MEGPSNSANGKTTLHVVRVGLHAVHLAERRALRPALHEGLDVVADGGGRQGHRLLRQELLEVVRPLVEVVQRGELAADGASGTRAGAACMAAWSTAPCEPQKQRKIGREL